MIHQAVLTVAYAMHGPDLRTFARWTCLLCAARSPLMTYRGAVRAVDQHLMLTHHVAAPCVRIRDRGAA